MVNTLMVPAKMATVDLLEIKVFRNKGYDIIISVYDIVNKNLSCDSNFMLDLVIWPKFGNFGISMRQVVITSIL